MPEGTSSTTTPPPPPPPPLPPPISSLSAISTALSAFENSFTTLKTALDHLIKLQQSPPPSNITTPTGIPTFSSFAQTPFQQSLTKTPIFPFFGKSHFQESLNSDNFTKEVPTFPSFGKSHFQESLNSDNFTKEVPTFPSFGKSHFQESRKPDNATKEVPTFGKSHFQESVPSDNVTTKSTNCPSIRKSRFQESARTGKSGGMSEVAKLTSDSLFVRLKNHCVNKNSKMFMKCLVSSGKETCELRDLVTKLLKHAPNPARFVLKACGDFYVMMRDTFVNDLYLVKFREVAVLLLECFLKVGVGEDAVLIDKSVKKEADRAAMSWLERMGKEGGIVSACETDARGLLSFIACYGVPESFKNDDIRDLFRVSNFRGMPEIVRRSTVMKEKFEEITDGLEKSRREIEAVDLAYTLGLQDWSKSQRMLLSVLNRSREEWMMEKEASQGSQALINEANEKHLAVLKSIRKCLEAYKVDVSYFLCGWQFKEKILDLVEDIAEFYMNKEVKTSGKRKADEVEPGNGTNFQEVKYARYLGQGLQQHRFVRDYHTGIGRHVNGYSTIPIMLHVPVSAIDPYAGFYGAGNVINQEIQPVSAIDPYAGFIDPYGLSEDVILSEGIVAHGHASLPPSSTLPEKSSCSTLSAKPVAHGVPTHTSSSSVNNINKPSTSLEGEAVLPTASGLNQSMTSNV